MNAPGAPHRLPTQTRIDNMRVDGAARVLFPEMAAPAPIVPIPGAPHLMDLEQTRIDNMRVDGAARVLFFPEVAAPAPIVPIPGAPHRLPAQTRIDNMRVDGAARVLFPEVAAPIQNIGVPLTPPAAVQPRNVAAPARNLVRPMGMPLMDTSMACNLDNLFANAYEAGW
jgi:hypothetical protein